MQNLNGKSVAEAVFKDIESFFFHSAKFAIRKEFNPSGLHHASLKGKGDSARINLSKDFCEFEIDTVENLFFVMMTVCHESAHYLNKHNDHEDSNKTDFTAIETWADFFGARIFITVITFGKRSQSLMKMFMPELNQDAVLRAIGRAMKKMYQSIYLPTTDQRYPAAIERVLIFNAGVTSFFYRIYDSLQPKWTIYMLKTMLNESELTDIAAQHNADWSRHSQIANASSSIHKSIQGVDISITKGMKPQYISLLVTNYNLSEHEKRQRGKRLEEQVKIIGLDLEKYA